MASFYLGKNISKIGRKNAILYGGFLLSFSMLVFTFNLMIEN